MSPWIEASRAVAATRWLDESAVALRGKRVLEARSTVTGQLHRNQGPPLQPIFGQASVLGTLTLSQPVVGTSPDASSQVSGSLGWLRQAGGTSAGHSQVTGELVVGTGRSMAAGAAGGANVRGILAVKLYSYIVGDQAGDDWSDHEPAVSFGRDPGRTRVRFSPRSSGLTNEGNTWRP